MGIGAGTGLAYRVLMSMSEVIACPRESELVLVAHPDGDMQELAFAAAGDRYQVKRARTFNAALKIAQARNVDVVILSADPRHLPRRQFMGLKLVCPHLRALFILGAGATVEHTHGLPALGTVLPRVIDFARLQAAVTRAVSMSRMVSGVHALRRDSQPLLRRVNGLDVARRLSSAPPPPLIRG